MRRFISWTVNAALVIVAAALLTCCTRRPELAPAPEPQVEVASLARNNIAFFYFAVAEKAKLEASFCMRGFVDTVKRVVLVQGLLPVWIDSASEGSLFHRPMGCKDTTVFGRSVIGSLHFHPPWGTCELSATDIISAHYSPYAITGVVCKKDSLPRLEIIFRKEFDEAYNRIKSDTTRGTISSTGVYTITYRFRRP